MNASKPVTGDFGEDKVSALVQNVAEKYNVDAKDVNTNVGYEVSGSFTVENVDPSQADVIEKSVRESISKQTDIPVNEIDVKVNSDTGIVEYTVSSDSYDVTNTAKENIVTDTFIDTIEATLQSIDNDVNITSAEINDEILADINIIVDRKDYSSDMSDATASFVSTIRFISATIVSLT